MYTIKTIDEILTDQSQYLGYHLCYVDSISDTIYDYDEASKKFMESPDFSWEREKELFGWNSPRLRMCDQPNPEYVKGEKEVYAYFTPLSLDIQWGDDWNDSPYEHNAGSPYDSEYFGSTRVEHEILQVPFAIPEKVYCNYPCDWGGCNSPFSVEVINLGVIPWIFAYTDRKENKSVLVRAGINPYEFIYKLSEIKNL